MPDEQNFGDAELASIHRRAVSETSPKKLDDAVLRAAREALENASDDAPGKVLPWTMRSLALAATLALGIAVAWRVTSVSPVAGVFDFVSEAQEETAFATKTEGAPLRETNELSQAATEAEHATPSGTPALTDDSAPETDRLDEGLAAAAKQSVQTNEMTRRAEAAPTAAPAPRNRQFAAEPQFAESLAPATTAAADDMQGARRAFAAACPKAERDLDLWRKCLDRLRAEDDQSALDEARRRFLLLFPDEPILAPADDAQ